MSLGKGLSRYFQTTHTVQLGTSQPASYQYAVTYVGSKKLSENDVRLLYVSQFIQEVDSVWCIYTNV